MELRIRDVSKTYPNGVQALLEAEPGLEDVYFSTMAGHYRPAGRRREPEIAR